uniref:Flotillin n=1 Tax=Nothobranchius furzeri TaxID=105023 RepID=A0A8C6KG10_NOTFU
MLHGCPSSSSLGFGRSPPLMIAGGRVFVIPCIQKIQRITLNTLTLNVKSDKVYTRHGVPISVTGIAQVKIQGQNKDMLATACQMFMGKSEAEVAQIALETLEGHQRAIIAHLTVEEIYQDRKKFSEQVFKVASSDLVNMGIGVVSYTLKDVHDDQDYLHSLGKARTAQVQKDARIGELMCLYPPDVVSAQYKNEIEMAKAQRDYELKKAAYDMEVNTKKAESEMAYQLQVAKTKQRIEEEKMQVQVVERTQQITLQEQEIIRKEKELEAKVKKPAEAEKYRLERLAEAQRLQLIMEAEAEAESVRMKGEAEAFALEAKGRAEAEQMTKKAEAFKQYKDGAMVDMLLEKLPLMAEEISRPMSEAQKITMVSSGGSEVGAFPSSCFLIFLSLEEDHLSETILLLLCGLIWF